MDLHEEALNKIAGDMDDMESKRMFPKETNNGATITISVMPGSPEAEEDQKGMEEGMSDGGLVDAPCAPDPEAEMGMPAFLRKKKGK